MGQKWLPKLENSNELTYVAIANAIAEGIESGQLSRGDRLITHRELANHLGISIGTASRAYAEAERRGLIYGNGRRGTYVGSAPDRSHLSSLDSSDSNLINLGRFFPSVLNDPDLLAALKELSRRKETQKLVHYCLPDGFDRHREVGARWLAKIGKEIDPGSVLISNGAQHALFVSLLGIAEKGDVIVTENHTYPGIKKVAQVLGLELAGISTDADGILPDELEEFCRHKKVKAFYTAPTLQNPTCTILPTERRHEIARIAEKHDVIIIEDEINRLLVSDPPALFAAIAPERTILLASISKLLAGGLRVAFMACPPQYRQSIQKAVKASLLVVSPLTLEIAAYWLESDLPEKIISNRRKDSRSRQRIVDEVLKGFTYQSYPTSYFIWLSHAAGWTPEGFAMELHRNGVVVAPADCFVIDSSRRANAVRVCIDGTVDNKELKKALKVIASISKSKEDADITPV